MLRVAFFSLTAALLCGEGSLQMTREGPYYVHTMSGPVEGRVPAQLRIVTRGNVILRGSKGEQVVYKLVQRVKTRSEAEAYRLLSGGVTATTPPLISVTTLTVISSATEQVSNDFEVS